MNTKILSIIIPSYNMQEYLHRSVKSLLDKEIIQEIEIIIVNDGSTDKTLEIAQSYQKQYPQSVLVINKKNGHYGSAVNAGINKASGKYLKVLDADDWFNTEEFVRFVKALHTIESVDVVFTRWCLNNVYAHTKIQSEEYINPLNQKLDINKIKTDSRLSFFSFFSLYAITYRTQLLREINYKQSEGICYTDVEYIYYPLLSASTVTFLNYNVYQYFVGREGQSINPAILKKNIRHHYAIYKRMIEDYTEPQSEIKRIFQVTAFVKISESLYFSFLLSNSPKERKDLNLKELDKRIKSKSPLIYEEIGKLQYHKLPYISLWRKWGWNFHVVYLIINQLKKIIHYKNSTNNL